MKFELCKYYFVHEGYLFMVRRLLVKIHNSSGAASLQDGQVKYPYLHSHPSHPLPNSSSDLPVIAHHSEHTADTDSTINLFQIGISLSLSSPPLFSGAKVRGFR